MAKYTHLLLRLCCAVVFLAAQLVLDSVTESPTAAVCKAFTSVNDLRSYFRPLSQLLLLKCNWERWSYAFFILEVVEYLQAVGKHRRESEHWAENEGFKLFHAALAEQRVDILHVVQSGREGVVPRHVATALGVMQRVRLVEHADQQPQQQCPVPASSSSDVTAPEPNQNPLGHVKASITSVECEILIELYLRFGQSAGAAKATTTMLQHAECQVLRYAFCTYSTYTVHVHHTTSSLMCFSIQVPATVPRFIPKHCDAMYSVDGLADVACKHP
jgi:hypothetical protein